MTTAIINHDEEGWAAPDAPGTDALNLLPYPQEITLTGERLALGPPQCKTDNAPTTAEQTAMESLLEYLPQTGPALKVRLGSVEEGYEPAWLTPEQAAFLADAKTSPEASVLTITPEGITVVGKGRWGMLYGAQAVNQLALDAARKRRKDLPCLTIRDWPDMRWRCLSPQLTWYSGWNRLEGYDCGNWTAGEWKWLADWSLLHKCNAWAVCMYGYWPFTLPGFDESILDVPSTRYNPKTGQKETYRFTHPNIKKEFYPEVIRYANARGVQVYAYIGKNSFNGGYILHHPETNAGGAAEALPFAPGVHEYWDAMLGRMLDLGFNGFVFEDPEAFHVPNQNEQCYQTFWAPWAQTYGYHSVAETNQNAPPLGVHVEYYTWLYRTFDEMIQRHARRLGIKPEIYLISHFLHSRVLAESKTPEEARKWMDLIDEKQGCKVRYVVAESREKEYVALLGGDRVASLGGRGGSCTNAMRRIASINNNWWSDGMGADIAYDRDAQRRIHEAGGFGAMGYIFEWTNTEVFGYIAAQYLWRAAGVPKMNNDDSVGFLDYAYRQYYGDKAGALVARVMDEGSCVNDAMVLEGVYGSQYPHTGKPLHRDYQYVAVLADKAVPLAAEAYREFTGREPDLERPVYQPSRFRWAGYDKEADHWFKAERLRQLCVSTRRSQLMCEAALAHRKAQRLIADGATAREVLAQYDAALRVARANERLYQINYDDDYDPTDGLCARVTQTLEDQRAAFLHASGLDESRIIRAWDFKAAGNPLDWTATHHMTDPVVQDGALVTQATGDDPFIVQASPLSLSAGPGALLEIQMASSQAGKVEVFWSTNDGNPQFLTNPAIFTIPAGNSPSTFRLPLSVDKPLTGLRLDPPDGASIRINAIRLVECRIPAELPTNKLGLHVPVAERGMAEDPLLIPWEKQTDIVPGQQQAKQSGLYLSIALGLNQQSDLYRLGVVFTVQARQGAGEWNTLFRRAVGRRMTDWEPWDIPLSGLTSAQKQGWQLRLLTDSYSRAAIDRQAPTWQWALWGEPQLVRVDPAGRRQVLLDLTGQTSAASRFVRLDGDGKDRLFDGPDEDSTGAAWRVVTAGSGPVMPVPARPAIAAFTPHKAGQFGLIGVDYEIPLELTVK